jgi:hypothetical protein
MKDSARKRFSQQVFKLKKLVAIILHNELYFPWFHFFVVKLDATSYVQKRKGY